MGFMKKLSEPHKKLNEKIKMIFREDSLFEETKRRIREELDRSGIPTSVPSPLDDPVKLIEEVNGMRQEMVRIAEQLEMVVPILKKFETLMPDHNNIRDDILTDLENIAAFSLFYCSQLYQIMNK